MINNVHIYMAYVVYRCRGKYTTQITDRFQEVMIRLDDTYRKIIHNSVGLSAHVM